MNIREIEKMQNILFEAVLNHVKEQARTKLPEKGIFDKFGIGFILPHDTYHGFLQIQYGQQPEKRVVDIGVYEEGSSRVVRNFLFFDSTKAVMDWLEAEESIEQLKNTALHLRQKADTQDHS